MLETVIADAVDEAIVTRDRMAAEDDSVRFAVYNIQRQFMGFLERIGLREEAVPNGRGEVAFYNLARFSQAISDFEAIYFHSRPVQKYESFAGFLRHQAESAYGESAGQDERFVSPDAVQILTIHRAKGLQWPVVFVPQLVRNRFPAARHGGRSIWHLIPDRCVAGQARFTGTHEDERRLFYVAVTRSQKHLHLTTAPTPGSRRRASRALLRSRTLRAARAPSPSMKAGLRLRRSTTAATHGKNESFLNLTHSECLRWVQGDARPQLQLKSPSLASATGSEWPLLATVRHCLLKHLIGNAIRFGLGERSHIQSHTAAPSA